MCQVHKKDVQEIACVQTSLLPQKKSSPAIFSEGGGTSVHRLFKKEPEARFHIASTTICRLENKMALFTKQKQSQLLSYKLVPVSHIQGFRDMIKHLFHSISSYMNYSQLGASCAPCWLHVLANVRLDFLK